MSFMELHRSDSKSMINYVANRERGAYCPGDNLSIPEFFTSVRRMKPLIAATPSDCRSTYLLRLNPANKLLAAAHGDRSVAVYCASTGALLAKCVGHERSPWTLAFHPNEPHLLASGCLGGNIRLWNLECLAYAECTTQTEIRQIASTSVWKHSGAIASLAFHPTHSILVAAWSQEVVFYDWVSGRKLSVWRFVSNNSRVRWVRFSPDGSLLYTATANPSAVHHPLTDNQEVQTGGPNVAPSGSKVKGGNSTKENVTALQPTVIPRDAILRFLVSRPDSWFQQLGICSACSVRLCRWAGTLGPEFPSSSVDLYRGLATVTRMAQSLASSMRLSGIPLSHLVQELLSADSPGIFSETTQCLLSDANPAAVAIIEDMPVREFLLSRGNYCPRPSSVIGEAGVCCGGHACDLVLAHRDLMRYSICRPCLAVFWRWTSQHVSWWRWHDNSVDYRPLQKSNSASCVLPTCQVDGLGNAEAYQSTGILKVTPGHKKHVMMRDTSESQSAVGICIRCRAKTNVSSKGTPCDLSFKSRESLCNTWSPETSQRCIPVAALELLQSRLGNANDVTQVTYMASELVSEGAVSKRIDNLLRSDPLFETVVRPLPATFLYLLQRAALRHGFTSIESPLRKRRKMNSLDNEKLDESIERSTTCFLNGSGVHSDFGDVVPTCKSSGQLVNGLAEQAALFGHLMMDASTQVWNKPCCVEIRSPPPGGVAAPPVCLKLFPYVPTGSRLLRPTVSTKAHCAASESMRMRICSTSTNSLWLSHTGSENNLHSMEQSTEVDGVNGRSMTACCRCGHIVPQTFPIDPHSSLSAVVCEKLVLSDDQCHSANSLPPRHLIFPRHPPAPTHDSPSTVIPQVCTTGEVINCDFSLAGNHGVSCTSNGRSAAGAPTCSAQPVSNHSSSSGGMFHLINHTNSDSMMHAVNRSITEVIAGLFVNMGEHGSANSLQEATYRVCRWELNLCGPIQTDCARCSPRKSGRLTATDELSLSGSFLPMPANVAVSYNTNSLVIPHARLFNDSSISLSPDGRMLAAFVAPQSHSSRVSELNHPTNEVDSSETSLNTMLAVYRLQPRSQRGQCLFARRFSTCTPVCLDFSPHSEYLAVGMATSRLPSAALPVSSLRRLAGNGLVVDSASSQNDLLGVRRSQPTVETPQSAPSSDAPLVPVRHAFVARIFRLERSTQGSLFGCSMRPIVHQLKETVRVQHPGLSDLVSVLPDKSLGPSTLVDVPSRWHRLLISSPSGISLNTIVWNPHGGLFYGTTKGLVVLMQSQPDTCQVNVDFTLGTPSVLPTKEMESEEHSLCASTQTKRKSVVQHSASTTRRFVRFVQRDNLTL